MSAKRWVIIDTETDGLSSPIHVIEIAAQLMEGWEPCGEPFQIFLNHGIAIPFGATAIHGYTQEFLRKSGRLPLEAHKFFRAYAKDYPIVAHNLGFDWNRALLPEWARLGLAPIGCRGFCTMLLSRRVLFEVASHRLDHLKTQFNLGDSESHKALSDVATVVRLFREALRPRLEAAKLITFGAWKEFSVRPSISDCLSLTNPSTPRREVRSYYLRSGQQTSSKQLLQSPSAKTIDARGWIRLLAKRVKNGGRIDSADIENMATAFDASGEVTTGWREHWLARWAERIICGSKFDETERK